MHREIASDEDDDSQVDFERSKHGHTMKSGIQPNSQINIEIDDQN